MNNYLALTIIADDRPGIIEKIAEPISRLGGNWLESNMSHLAGKFAGILLISLPEARQPELIKALQDLEAEGIKVQVESSSQLPGNDLSRVTLKLVANDRPGIIGELSSLFARNRVNVEELETGCESAPMSADALFKASATVTLPPDLSRENLRHLLEGLSDDLVVELED